MLNRILIYNSGGGIGDAIQILPLINSLKKEFKEAEFNYLCAHENHFNSSLKDLASEIKTLDLNIKYFGFRWWHMLTTKSKFKKLNIQKFDLIIDLQTKIRNTLILKLIPHKFFLSACLNFKLSKPSHKIKRNKNIIKGLIVGINSLFKTNCKLIDFNIKKIESKFFIEAERLLPKNNYVGFSITQGNIYRKKEWPLDKIVEICENLKTKNKTPVFFIEKKNIKLKEKISNLIPDALFPEHNTNLVSPALVTCLGQRLNCAISIDNGIMHMLSLGKVPMIVLFGPTDSEKFAPNYNGVISLDSKKLKNTTDISAITAQDVLKALEQHLNF